MSLQTTMEQQLSSLQRLHANLPPFEAGMNFGDLGHWTSVGGWVPQCNVFDDLGLNRKDYELTSGSETNIDCRFEAEYKVSGEGNGVVQPDTNVKAKANFSGANSWLLTAPNSYIYHISDVKGFANDVYNAALTYKNGLYKVSALTHLVTGLGIVNFNANCLFSNSVKYGVDVNIDFAQDHAAGGVSFSGSSSGVQNYEYVCDVDVIKEYFYIQTGSNGKPGVFPPRIMATSRDKDKYPVIGYKFIRFAGPDGSVIYDPKA